MSELPRIPAEVRDLVIARDEAHRAHRLACERLQAALEPHAGKTFGVEGVPVKVCGTSGARYLRRIVGPDESQRLRVEWLDGAR